MGTGQAEQAHPGLIARFDTWARPLLAAWACRAATPVSIAAHCLLYTAWWVSGWAQIALAIAMSLEAIVIGLVIIDKQNTDAAQDHAWQKRVFTELLDKLPDAEPGVAETDQ